MLLQQFVTNYWRACTPNVPQGSPKFYPKTFEELGELFPFPKYFWGKWGTVAVPQILLRNTGTCSRSPIFLGNWWTCSPNFGEHVSLVILGSLSFANQGRLTLIQPYITPELITSYYLQVTPLNFLLDTFSLDQVEDFFLRDQLEDCSIFPPKVILSLYYDLH